jgi:hypothetical protein
MKLSLLALLYTLSIACYAQVNDFRNFRSIAQIEDSIKYIESHDLQAYHYLHNENETNSTGFNRYYTFWTQVNSDIKKGAILYKQDRPIINLSSHSVHLSVRLTDEDEQKLIKNRKTVHIIYYFYEGKVIYIAERKGETHTKIYILSDDKFVILDNDRFVKLTEDRRKYVELQLKASRFLQSQYDNIHDYESNE